MPSGFLILANPPETFVGAAPAPAPAAADQAAAAAQPDLFAFPPSDEEMAAHYVETGTTPPTAADLAPRPAATLYVGCMPVGEHFVMLEDWIAPLMEEAAQSTGVTYYAQADFGKGKAALAALIVHKSKVQRLPEALVVDPRLPSADVALEILRPLYSRKVLKLG